MTSYFSTLLWGTSQLDDAVDKATSELLPSGSEDIALSLEISDQIRSKSVSPKDAMRALKRRLNHKNPNVQLLALGLTDTCIKNGGDPFLVEIASREFMDNLVSILKIPVLNHEVKNKILRLVQIWAIAFEGRGNLAYVGEVYRTLQNEGFNFPPRDPALATSAMVDTQTAPEWIDSDVCLRCRDPFSFTNRKHHCRNCGQVFDHKCSSKTLALPHFGITQEVRVCDSCHTKLSKKHISHRSSQSVSSSRHRSARDLADAELQRAIQLSLQEVGSGSSRRPSYAPSTSSWQASEPPLVDQRSHPGVSSRAPIDEEDDPDLRAAIEASLREASAPKPSAPMGIDTPRAERSDFSYTTGPGYAQSYPSHTPTPKPTVPTLPQYDLDPLEEDAILTFSQTVDQLQQQGGRDLSRYPAVTELYDKASGLRPKLAMSLNDTGRKEQLLTEMHEKLSEAVKLYDKLLSEQVSHPTWRAATSPRPAGATYQQTPAASYGQWSIPPQQTAPPQTPSSYFNPQPPAIDRAPSASSTSYAVSPVADPYAQPSNAQPFVSVPLQSPRTEYTSQSQQQPYAVAPPPVTIQQYQAPLPPPPAEVHVPNQPSQPYQISAPGPQIMQPSTSPPPLSRHNTVTSRAPIPPAQARPPVRSSTISYSHTPQQLQQLQQTHVPQPLPNLPAAPTAPPQAYEAYASPRQEPQREALLIDL
ncbi:hypothetical protein BDY19DRAFT_1088196 [Irpex rosettiformis]|uniref:Uncharacterized protein n=1 Tax=Irpex rosettiformis TaxID=378272 RepID=A0ACB8U6G4_9APHY|nr:hypothetical protein BDY19DRAFT_1088196 [Irpex rosettiformis]